MRDNEVPQEGNSTLDGHRKAVYARGDDGKLHLSFPQAGKLRKSSPVRRLRISNA